MRPLGLAFVLAACTTATPTDNKPGGGKGDDPSSDVVTAMTTAWEAPVGSGGDAVVDRVVTLADGNLLATSRFPMWVHEFSSAGQPIMPTNGPGTLLASWPTDWHHTRQIWQVSTNELVTADGEEALLQLHGFTADGLPNPMFGDKGVIQLPGYVGGYSSVKAIEYDAERDRFLALVVRAWEVSDSYTIGPSQIEVLAFDAHTGAMTSAGAFTLPDWEDLEVTDPAQLHELVAQPDGSFVVLASNTLYAPADPGYSPLPVMRWSVFHLVADAPPTQITLTVADYLAWEAAFTRLGEGHFDLYLDGGVDYTSGDQRLVRITLDGDLAPHMDDLGPAVDHDHGCLAATASPSMFIYGHSPDRDTMPMELTAYPKDGAPFTFMSDKPQRCLLDLSFGEAGRLYAGTWNTSSGAWIALLTALVPE
jgi:hypothetical protein